MNRSLPGRYGTKGISGRGNSMHKCSEAGTSKTRLEMVETSNPSSQAFKDAQGSIPLYPLEPSCPSTALKACSPLQHCSLPPAVPLQEITFHHLHLPHDFTVLPSRTCLNLPVSVVTTQGGHTAEAQAPGLTLVPPFACPLAWTGAGSWLHSRSRKAMDKPSPPRPHWTQHWTLHAAGTQCGLMGRNGEEVS